MKNLEYQQRAVTELIDKTIRLLNAGGQRNKMVFEATTGAGKTVMACQMLAGLMDDCTTVVTVVIRKWHLYGLPHASCTYRVTKN